MGGGVCKCYCSPDNLSKFPQRDYLQLLPQIYSDKAIKKIRSFRDEVVNPQFIASGTLEPILNDQYLPPELTSRHIAKIVCGSEHFLALSQWGELLGCGSNKHGQLGQEDAEIFEKLIMLDNIVEKSDLQFKVSTPSPSDIACGATFSMVLIKGKARSQRVLTFGEGRYLGVKRIDEGWKSYSLHQKRSTHMPQSVKLDKLGERILHIYANFSHGCIIGKKGAALVFGEDFSGFPVKQPKLFYHFGDRLLKMVVGRGHGLALTSKGEVYSWGDDTFSEVGSSLISIPVQSMDSHEFERSVIKNSKLPQLLTCFSQPAMDIAAGARHSCVLLITGELFCFGDNSEQQCGELYKPRCAQPHKIELVSQNEQAVKFEAVFSGETHNVGVSEEGVLYSWGGREGILKIGKGLQLRSPISEVDIVKGKYLSLATLSNNNTIFLSGDASHQLGEVQQFEDSSVANSS